jgi:hypothetical protein
VKIFGKSLHEFETGPERISRRYEVQENERSLLLEKIREILYQTLAKKLDLKGKCHMIPLFKPAPKLLPACAKEHQVVYAGGRARR